MRFNSFAKKKQTIKRSTAERSLPTIKMQGTNRNGEGGRREKSLLCDPGSALRLGWRERKGEDDKWDEKRKKRSCPHFFLYKLLGISIGFYSTTRSTWVCGGRD